jgi:hypothetical protein
LFFDCISIALIDIGVSVIDFLNNLFCSGS